MKIFLLDNFDSFTYNVAQLLQSLGAEVIVRRNNEITVKEIKGIAPGAIVISPGPMRPRDHPLVFGMIEEFYRSVPILGICLGMQAVNEFFGGDIKRAGLPVHGKTSLVYHSREGLFQGIPSPFKAARYHSLIAGEVPDVLEITATTADKTIMGLRHKTHLISGVQFHPESYLTEHGAKLISNFLQSIQ